MPKKKRKKLPSAKYRQHRKLYAALVGIISDAFNSHPEYLAQPERKGTVSASIAKRITGTLMAAPHLVRPSGTEQPDKNG